MVPRSPHTLTYRGFFDIVGEELPALLPPGLRDYQGGRQWSVYKIHFGERTRHYELWFRDGGLEVAYHLEGRPDQDEPVARVLRQRLNGIRRSLGGDVRLEPFGQDWHHLFEIWPGSSRDEDLALEAAARLAEFVRFLEPVLRAESPRPR